MIKEINVKTILSKQKYPEKWFGISYNTNFYRGCTHGCIYCDSRSECYRVENFDDIEVKVNAPFLLENALKSNRRVKSVIGTGSMCDPYMPIEKKYRITRKCLEVIDRYEYPVTILTKSDLILDDIELLKSINSKTKATVLFTITTVDDELAKIIEPYAPLSSKRLEAIRKLVDEGIYVGVLLMPILPFIEDNKRNIKEVISRCSEVGVSFIHPFFGVTLRDRQRDYYFDRLDKHFIGLKEKYIEIYGNSYSCFSLNYKELKGYFIEMCKKYNVIYDMKQIEVYKGNEQLELFNVEK